MTRWPRRRIRALAIAVSALAAVTLASTAAPVAFVSYDGYSRTGMNVAEGGTAVIGLGPLRPAHGGSRVELVSATVGGRGIDARVGRLEGVKVYRITDQGGIGAVTGAELAGFDGGPGWTLLEPAGAVISEQTPPWDAVVVVTGVAEGVWSADYVDFVYRVDGRRGTQRIDVGATVCVGSLDRPPCNI